MNSDDRYSLVEISPWRWAMRDDSTGDLYPVAPFTVESLNLPTTFSERIAIAGVLLCLALAIFGLVEIGLMVA